MDELKSATAKFIETVNLIIQRIDDDIAKQRIELEEVTKQKTEIQNLQKSLADERNLIEKEKAIDAERKLRLNAQEKVLKEKLEKAQQLFET